MKANLLLRGLPTNPAPFHLHITGVWWEEHREKCKHFSRCLTINAIKYFTDHHHPTSKNKPKKQAAYWKQRSPGAQHRLAKIDGKYLVSFSKMAESTVEKGQFLFCSLCRLNHDRGRKHIYSRKHKTLLGKILMKFGKKVWELESTDAKCHIFPCVCRRTLTIKGAWPGQAISHFTVDADRWTSRTK